MKINLLFAAKLSLTTTVLFSNAIFAAYCNPGADGSASGCVLTGKNDTSYKATCAIKSTNVVSNPNPLAISSKSSATAGINNNFTDKNASFDLGCTLSASGVYKGACTIRDIMIDHDGFILPSSSPSCSAPSSEKPFTINLSLDGKTNLQAEVTFK